MAIILEFGKKMIFIYENYLKLLLVCKIRVKFAEFLKIKTRKVLRGDFAVCVVKSLPPSLLEFALANSWQSKNLLERK